MFPQRFAYHCGTILFGSASSLVGGAQQLRIENDLDGFHMSTLFHSILHILISGYTSSRERSSAARAASSAGAMLMAAQSHAVFQNPKTGMR